MLNNEIIQSLQNAMNENGIDEENQKIIEKFFNDLSINSIKNKSEIDNRIRNILSRINI